jgi:curli biogenesis system outer membrane secretion channel CsgG
MKRAIALFVSLAVVVAALPAFSQPGEAVPETPLVAKKRVAVFAFENKATGSWEVGRGVADMLVTALVKSGKFRVIERAELERVMQEQGMGLTGAITQQSAAQVGKLLGVELAIFGAVTEFGESKKETSVGGLGGVFGGGGGGITKSKARVAIDIRFVNTSTGEILYAESVAGEESSLGVSVDVRDIDFATGGWDDTKIGKATRKAVDQIVDEIAKQMKNIPWTGSIVKVSDDGRYAFINAGAVAGLATGNVFFVYQKGEELIDPDLGISLGSEETLIGKIQVLDPNIGEGKASKCLILDGTGFSRGDLVKER